RVRARFAGIASRGLEKWLFSRCITTWKAESNGFVSFCSCLTCVKSRCSSLAELAVFGSLSVRWGGYVMGGGLPLHGRGQRFEPSIAHHSFTSLSRTDRLSCCDIPGRV